MITFSVTPLIALSMIAGGVLLVYLEFARPGLVIPAVTGCLLVAFGLRGLWRYPLDWRGATLIATGAGLLAIRGLRGAFAVPGTAAVTTGLRLLVIDPAVGWSAAMLIGLPLSGLTAFLFAATWRARINKRIRIF